MGVVRINMNALEIVRRTADTLVELEVKKIMLLRHRIVNRRVIKKNNDMIVENLVTYMFYKQDKINDVDLMRKIDIYSEFNHGRDNSFVRIRYYMKDSDQLEEDYYNYRICDKTTNVERKYLLGNSYIQIYNRYNNEIFFDEREFDNTYRGQIIERSCNAEYVLDA